MRAAAAGRVTLAAQETRPSRNFPERRPGTAGEGNHLPPATPFPATPSRATSAQRAKLLAWADRRNPVTPFIVPLPWLLSSPYMDTRMSDVIPTLGNRRPRIQAWLGRRLMRGGRRGREGGAGMLTDASLHHWEQRLLLGHWARAAEGAGSRGKGRLWRLKSRRLAGERCQCGVDAARGRQEASKFESRLRQPQQGAASLGCCSLLKGEGRSEWFAVFLSVPIFLRVRRPRLSLWGASPQGQSLLRVCTDFGPRPPALTPPCPSSTHAPSRASWSRWPSRSPTWSSCMRRGRWTARLFRTSPPLCRPCRPLSATWCG